MANVHFLRMVSALGRLFREIEGEEKMVSWRRVEGEFAGLPESRVKRIKAEIKEQVRQELRKEMQVDPKEVEEERDVIKQFARDMEIEGLALSTLAASLAEKASKQVSSLRQRLVGLLVFAPIFMTAAFAVLSSTFPPPDGDVTGLIITAVIGSIVTCAFGTARFVKDLDAAESKVSDMNNDANRYRLFAEEARTVWRTDVHRAHSIDALNKIMTDLKRSKEGAQSWTSMKVRVPDIEPIRQKIRIEMMTEEDIFEERLEEAQQAEEEASLSSKKA